jgi:hypothetical protein
LITGSRKHSVFPEPFQTTDPVHADGDIEVVYPDEIYEPWESIPYNSAGTTRITFDHDTWYADRAA